MRVRYAGALKCHGWPKGQLFSSASQSVMFMKKANKLMLHLNQLLLHYSVKRYDQDATIVPLPYLDFTLN